MQGFQPMPNYYQMPVPYSDRLAQLQNQYQQTVTVPQAPQQHLNQGILWVSGEVGAKSYLVAPNSTVLLMDSDAQRFYLKSADGAGMPSLRVFEYSEVTSAPASALTAANSPDKDLDGKYVTREEYEGLKRHYDKILERLDSITVGVDPEQAAKPKSKSKVVMADE